MLVAMIFMAGIIPQLHAVIVTNNTELPISISLTNLGESDSYTKIIYFRLSPGENTGSSEYLTERHFIKNNSSNLVLKKEKASVNISPLTRGSVSDLSLKLKDSDALQASYDITYDQSVIIATKTADDGKTYNNKTGYPIKFKYKRKNHSNSHSVSKNVDESYTLNDNNDKMKYVEICFDIKDSSKVTADTGDFSVTYKDGALSMDLVA